MPCLASQGWRGGRNIPLHSALQIQRLRELYLLSKNEKKQLSRSDSRSRSSHILSPSIFKAMDAYFPESMKPHAQSLPPRRGQIKVKMLKVITAGIVTGFGGKKNGIGGSPSSNSTTPAAIPSGYNSDASSS